MTGDNAPDTITTLSLRPPETVMDLTRLGSFHPTRLSFMRVLIRRMSEENWRIKPTNVQLDDNGYGTVVLTASGPGRDYSLVAVSSPLDPEQRTDRVIAERWDATFALFDGIPIDAEVDRLSKSVPLQEAGRYRKSELVLSRANRSVRLFDHVVECLSKGQQPDGAMLNDIGYLMRTTAVYGNGKFGIADRFRIVGRPELQGAFAAELLCVYLIREFTFLLVDHVVAAKNPQQSVKLDDALKTNLGIGNATGLGMAPFLINHPVLVNNWILARETALARVLEQPTADLNVLSRFKDLIGRAAQHVNSWQTDDGLQTERIEILKGELAELQLKLRSDYEALSNSVFPYQKLFQEVCEHSSLEMQELCVSVLIECHGPIVDDLCADMVDNCDNHDLPVSGVIGDLKDIVANKYEWAFSYDFTKKESMARFWYVSEEKLEPRLGERFEEPGAELESPLATARDVQLLWEGLDEVEDTLSIAEFLMKYPEFRRIVRRILTLYKLPYGEIRANLIDTSMRPIDLLRCKLSFFGASRFDPKSDRWTRVTLFQGAPLAHNLADPNADDWAFPHMVH